ncbi:MAG: MaoC family dehydratase [Desulfobacteraceae bacterium]|nr:MaoC family dehydratase [Desulfobacteraceae bacterium]
MFGKGINEIKEGEKAEIAKTVSEADVYSYAGITGDLNPAHINEEYAKKTFFKTRIVHGMLLGGFISAVIGTRLPGPGTIYLSQELHFKAPVQFGDTVTAEVEIKEIIHEKNRVILATKCTNQDGKLLVDGTAVVSPPKKK